MSYVQDGKVLSLTMSNKNLLIFSGESLCENHQPQQRTGGSAIAVLDPEPTTKGF